MITMSYYTCATIGKDTIDYLFSAAKAPENIFKKDIFISMVASAGFPTNDIDAANSFGIEFDVDFGPLKKESERGMPPGASFSAAGSYFLFHSGTPTENGFMTYAGIYKQISFPDVILVELKGLNTNKADLELALAGFFEKTKLQQIELPSRLMPYETPLEKLAHSANRLNLFRKQYIDQHPTN
jgi:hypothetical protein